MSSITIDKVVIKGMESKPNPSGTGTIVTQGIPEITMGTNPPMSIDVLNPSVVPAPAPVTPGVGTGTPPPGAGAPTPTPLPLPTPLSCQATNNQPVI